MKKSLLVFAAVLILTGICRADEPTPSKFYRLHFVVQETDGNRVLNSREYDGTASTEQGSRCSLRTEFNVIGSGTPLLLGVRIDASRLQERPSGLFVQVEANITSIPQEALPSTGSSPNERFTVRTNLWNSTLLIPLKKSTVIFSSDDLTSKHKMQLVLTATPIL